jgi:tRNA-Thr(GGU) m(6)t(6)A37 methyltransferase TsaA
MKPFQSKPITFQPIGFVQNAFNKDTPRSDFKDSESKISLDPALTPGLDGLVTGQQIYILFHLHRSEGYDLYQHPRGDQDRPKRGLFSLRTPRRPNPIGLSKVELVSIKGNQLTVRGLDAIHGTPVLDLKPA